MSEEHPGMDELPLHAWDWSDDEPDITTGYEVHDMQPIPVLEDSEGRKPEQVQGSTGSEATEAAPPLQDAPETATGDETG